MRFNPLLFAALLIIAAAGFAAVMATVDTVRRSDPQPRPTRPWRAEAFVTSLDSRASLVPKGGTIAADGSLTILEAPPSAGRPAPLVHGTAGPNLLAQPFDPAPAAMLRGVRALFRLVPSPADERDELVTRNLDYRATEGQLVMVRGCLRFGGADGPYAIMPPGTRFGLRDGWLMVGPPGSPPAFSARIGERIFWEDDPHANFDEGTRRRVRARCGPGPIAYVVPSSASVRQAQEEGFLATVLARDEGMSWTEALRQVQECTAEEQRRNAGRVYVGGCERRSPPRPQPT